MVKDNFVQSEDLSNHTRTEHNLVKDTEEKGKKSCNIDLKISMKSCSTTYNPPFLSSNPKILKAFLKTFPTKMKPTKCPARENMRQEKRKKREGDNWRLLCHFKTQLNLEILLSAHVQTSQANILHLDQKAVFVVSFSSLCKTVTRKPLD